MLTTELCARLCANFPLQLPDAPACFACTRVVLDPWDDAEGGTVFIGEGTVDRPDRFYLLCAPGAPQHPNAAHYADPALTLSAATEDETDSVLLRAGIPPHGRYLCFALRRWPGFEEAAPAIRAAAAYAYKTLGYKKAAVLTDVANDYAVGLSNFFKKTFKKIGGELVADMKYSSGDQDFTAQLTELISKKPDIVFMPAYFAEGAIIMKQARELGATFVLMGADAMDNPDTLKIGGKAVEGFLHTTFPYDVNMENMSAEAKTFTDAWKKNFPNKDPNVNSALGYNCYNIILDALTRAGKADTEALTAALAATKNLPTALGVLSINETHDAEMPVGIIKYMDGKRKYIGDAIAE